jgi:modification methylase
LNSCTVIRGDAFSVCGSSGIQDGSIDLIVTDPPYGSIVDEAWDGSWSLAHYHRLTRIIERVLKPGGTAYVWGGIGTYRNRLFLEWISRLEHESHHLIVWDVITWRKRRARGSDKRYLFVREECAMIVNGEKPATFNVPLLDVKRGYPGYDKDRPARSEFLRRTDVWDDVTEILSGKIHPCEKPSRLAEIMIETSSKPGDLVLDMFAGSGSTGVAANKLGRRSILIEQSGCKMHDV